MISHIQRKKKWRTKSCSLWWKGIGRALTLWGVLITNVKLIKHWCELMLVTRKQINLIKSDLVEIYLFNRGVQA